MWKLAKLLLAYGADPHAMSSDRRRWWKPRRDWPSSLAISKGKPNAERLAVVKLLVELGARREWADAYGITPLMVAANLGDTELVEYLVEVGADLGAYDLGKKT